MTCSWLSSTFSNHHMSITSMISWRLLHWELRLSHSRTNLEVNHFCPKAGYCKATVGLRGSQETQLPIAGHSEPRSKAEPQTVWALRRVCKLLPVGNFLRLLEQHEITLKHNSEKSLGAESRWHTRRTENSCLRTTRIPARHWRGTMDT